MVWSPGSLRDSQESSPIPQLKSINSLVLSFLYGPTLIPIHDYWKNHSFDYTDLCQQSNELKPTNRKFRNGMGGGERNKCWSWCNWILWLTILTIPLLRFSVLWSPSTLSPTHLANLQIAIRREPCNHVDGLDWRCIGFSLFIEV